MLDALRAYVVVFLITPGGREFWEDFRHVFGADVSGQLDEFIRDEGRPAAAPDRGDASVAPIGRGTASGRWVWLRGRSYVASDCCSRGKT